MAANYRTLALAYVAGDRVVLDRAAAPEQPAAPVPGRVAPDRVVLNRTVAPKQPAALVPGLVVGT